MLHQYKAKNIAVKHCRQTIKNQEKINKLNSFTPYEILGVTEFSTIEEIKASYKKKVLKYHPDRGGDPGVFSIIEKC